MLKENSVKQYFLQNPNKNTFGEEYEGEASCMDWLQSEAE